MRDVSQVVVCAILKKWRDSTVNRKDDSKAGAAGVNLYVKNLDETTTDDDLKELFEVSKGSGFPYCK